MMIYLKVRATFVYTTFDDLCEGGRYGGNKFREAKIWLSPFKHFGARAKRVTVSTSRYLD